MAEKFFRELFEESWLYEQPQRTHAMNTFGVLLVAITDLQNHGIKPVHISSNLFKIELNNVIYYWYEVDHNPVVIVELDLKPQSVVVRLVGKKNQGSPPWVTDLYDDILKDRGKSITLHSDSMLTDGGFSIWKRMLQNGRNISFYDTSKPGVTFKKIDTVEELQSVFGSAKNFKDIRYVLSEEKNAFFEALVLFISRRTLELTGRLQ